MTSRTRTPGSGAAAQRRARSLAAAERARLAAEHAARRRSLLLWGIGTAVVVAIVAAMMWTSRTTSDAATRAAPDFTLTNTAGRPVHLGDYRGHTVVLYFNEGAGCQACLYQMAAIEQDRAHYADAGIIVLPIVMNTPDEIRADMAANNVATPFLIDADGSVSRAYGTLGKGMHAGLPGHSFVLIDRDGVQRWYGEYPSMYLSPADLLTQIRRHLT